MEIDLEPRVKPLSYKVKGMSRESSSQKAAHILETDLRSHWSTGTNTKEWILLELDEPCLLSHIRIYNKSVLEWEVSVGLRYKPELFVKVRPRCEAPRRDMVYPTNYTPCRYVRISCLRGNPIAIFFIQPIGVSVPSLEPEFQPVVNHLLPHIVAHKQDSHDLYLQLLQDMTSRLLTLLPQLEADLSSFPDAADSNLHFLAMLTGPFYSILQILSERETGRSVGNVSDSEIPKNGLSSSVVTVSSNFEPRRSRGTSSLILSTPSSVAFRPDVILLLLRKACKDSDLGIVCRTASAILQKLVIPALEENTPAEAISMLENTSKSESLGSITIVDYSSLFGVEFKMPDYEFDSSILNILDIAAVEEGILHVLFACASQPLLCSKLSENASKLWFALPLVQALLPALRPCGSISIDHIDNFSLWDQGFVQQAFSQIVLTLSSPSYNPLLQACAGYLSSFSHSHAKAACVLIDLCSGVLAPWLPQIIAKVDLAIELLEDLLGTIQGACQSMSSGRAALKYIVLALAGHMDDIMAKYKEVKHKILFLLEMLEPFLDPAMHPLKSRIAFGDVSATFTKKQEETCVHALNVIRTAALKPAVLPSLESEWRHGSVAPSVLLSILDPQMQLPAEIDLRKFHSSENAELESAGAPNLPQFGSAARPPRQVDSEFKVDQSESVTKIDSYEDVRLFFAPQELRSLQLTISDGICNESSEDIKLEHKDDDKKNTYLLPTRSAFDTGFSAEWLNLQRDYFQLVNIRDCELRASDFQHLARELHSHEDISVEGHDAAIDALLLAAECYVNPFFLKSFLASSKIMDKIATSRSISPKELDSLNPIKLAENDNTRQFETVAQLEKQRDKIVLQILLEAAELDRKFMAKVSNKGQYSYAEESDTKVVELSPDEITSLDAITLVRQNQALLSNFLVQRLHKEQHSMHEILMQCLVFLLHSATKLFCAPEDVISIVLQSTESLNKMLIYLYCQRKEGSGQLSPEMFHTVQRRWLLLQRLVIASSGCDEDFDSMPNVNNGYQHQNLIPPPSWMQNISTFSRSSYPLVRFLGWMGVSRIAKQFSKDRLYLVSDLSQLTCLLSIFSDELAVVDKFVNRKPDVGKGENLEFQEESSNVEDSENDDFFTGAQSVRILYPFLGIFFPKMKRQFEGFGELILEAVSLQLRLLSSAVLPDILSWFSDLCSWPFFQKDQSSWIGSDLLKGYVAKNSRAIILYMLEGIVKVHMEAMVPEIPRVVHVVISICKASYCDVSFISSVLLLLDPLISYSLHKNLGEKSLPADDSCHDLESLCFEELFISIQRRDYNEKANLEEASSRAPLICFLAAILPVLSFERRIILLQSMVPWTDFPMLEATSSFHDYLCAFQAVLESCKVFLVQTLRVFGFLPLQSSGLSESTTLEVNEPHRYSFLKAILHDPVSLHDAPASTILGASDSNQKDYKLSMEEIEEFANNLEDLIVNLHLKIDKCWNLHNQLSKKLILTSAECFVCSLCLASTVSEVQKCEEDESKDLTSTKSDERLLVHWKIGLEGLAKTITVLQERQCWEVASAVIECLLETPSCFHLENVIDFICSAIKKNVCSAPKFAWRLQSEKWLSLLFARATHHSLRESDVPPLVDLFCAMLGHPEPEQRLIGLKVLGKLVGQNVNEGLLAQSSITCIRPLGNTSFAADSISSLTVSSMWDSVISVASSDMSMRIKTRAMALLVDFIPLASRQQLQSFLQAADSVLLGFGKPGQLVCEGPVLKLSLALLASACLYSSVEDITLVPPVVWKSIELLGSSKADGRLGDVERKACQVLCRLRTEGDDAKEVLMGVLSSNGSQQFDPDFESTRESILLVLSSLTSTESYFELFSNKREQEIVELEEAEMELDLLRSEHKLPDLSHDSKLDHQVPGVATSLENENRLQQIKDRIKSLEKDKLREDVAARRQKKLLMRHARQKYLEEAALREAELLQELDRERMAEAEREIERQQMLEVERAKTRELRHQLELEKERQSQRELQREVEQAESGLRPSRRDFSSSNTSRPRDRYRDRESGRSGGEMSTRTSSGSLQQESSSTINVPAVVLTGSRTFSGQPPTILQSRDRADDCSSNYEENLDGSKDSGDTGSVGDPELVSAFEGQSGTYGSAQRHGSRGSKSRQVTDRRERGEGRRDSREGKWERKH